jgi:hypothetical protein
VVDRGRFVVDRGVRGLRLPPALRRRLAHGGRVRLVAVAQLRAGGLPARSRVTLVGARR